MTAVIALSRARRIVLRRRRRRSSDPRDPIATLVFAAGGAANAVYVFDLDATGRLIPTRATRSRSRDRPIPAFADRGISFPRTLLAATDGRRVYVVNMGGDSVAAIDTATRRLVGAPRRVGFSPCGVDGRRFAPAGDQRRPDALRLVAGAGRGPAVRARRRPTRERASSLSLLRAGSRRRVGERVHCVADGPGARRLAPGRRRASDRDRDHRRRCRRFVAMTNVDRIATVALGGVRARRRRHRIAALRSRSLRHAAGSPRALPRRIAPLRRAHRARRGRGDRRARPGASASAWA